MIDVRQILKSKPLYINMTSNIPSCLKNIQGSIKLLIEG